MEDPTILISFAAEFRLICKQYEIFQLERIWNPIVSWDSSQGTSYSKHMQEWYEKTGQILFFYHNSRAKAEILPVAPTKICFDSLNGLQEAKVNDLGHLVEELRPGLKDAEKYSKLPVEVSGNLVIPDNELQIAPTLSIGLYTDIWLPYVIDFGDRESWGRGLKRNPLAQCHTPRFNQWLNAVRLLGITYGASWKPYQSQALPAYPSMLGETGIQLNYQPKSDSP